MRRVVPFVVLIAVVAVLNGWLDQRFYVRVLTLSVVWALAGVAWNLMAKAGQISLGHSAFVGIGAYGFTILLRGGGTSPWTGMAIGMGVAAAVALVIGLPTFRLRGFYFTLATISFPLIMELLVSHYGDPELTVPFHPESEWRFMEFSNSHTYVWVGLGMLVVALAISELIDVTSFGFALRAIRDNEVLARAVGIRTVAWKSAAFMISAALSAAMAVLWVKAVLRVTVAEEVFGITVVIVMLSVAFVGGVGQTWGPVVGAAFLIPLAMFLDDSIGESVPGAQELVYAAALVLVALLIPRGILPAIEKGCRRLATWPRTSLEQAGPSLLERLAAPAPRPSPLLRMPRRPLQSRLPQPSDTPVLEVEGVAKSFGANRVLSDVAFNDDAGRRVGIIGPNGAGKIPRGISSATSTSAAAYTSSCAPGTASPIESSRNIASGIRNAAPTTGPHVIPTPPTNATDSMTITTVMPKTSSATVTRSTALTHSTAMAADSAAEIMKAADFHATVRMPTARASTSLSRMARRANPNEVTSISSLISSATMSIPRPTHT